MFPLGPHRLWENDDDCNDSIAWGVLVRILGRGVLGCPLINYKPFKLSDQPCIWFYNKGR